MEAEAVVEPAGNLRHAIQRTPDWKTSFANPAPDVKANAMASQLR
jgi:hypothetical protein